MSDDNEIRNLVADYCMAADDKEFDRWAALFADDGRLLLNDDVAAAGRDGVHKWLAGRPMPAGRHFTSNLRVATDGDQAEARCYFFFLTPDREIASSGQYHVRCRKTAAGWRVSEWRIAF